MEVDYIRCHIEPWSPSDSPDITIEHIWQLCNNCAYHISVSGILRRGIMFRMIFLLSFLFSYRIDTNIEVIVVSLTTWKAQHGPRAKPEGCGELPRSLMRQQWPTLRYQFLFYHDETISMMNKQMLFIQIFKIVPKLSPSYSMVTCPHFGVRWPDCFSLVTHVKTTAMSH